MKINLILCILLSVSAFSQTWPDYLRNNYGEHIYLLNPGASPYAVSDMNHRMLPTSLNRMQYYLSFKNSEIDPSVFQRLSFQGDEFPKHRIGRNHSGNHIFTLRETREDISVIFGDIRVNELAGPIGGLQDFSVAAASSDGTIFLAWVDYRNGDSDIYGQMYSSTGIPLGENFKINSDDLSYPQNLAAITATGNNEFIVVWDDRRNGYLNLFGQRFDSGGNQIGNNFLVASGGSLPWGGDFGVSAAADGRFIVTWPDSRDGISSIFCRLYNSDATPLSEIFQVNIDNPGNSERSPTVSMADNGDFYITWLTQDNEDGGYDVYCQKYTSNGALSGGNLMVNDNTPNGDCIYPSTVIDQNNIFSVTWTEDRNGGYDIYIQRYSADLEPLGSNTLVNDDVGSFHQFGPHIASDEYGTLAITWDDMRNGDSDVYCQYFAPNGDPVGNNIKVNDYGEGTHQDFSGVAASDSGEFVIVWSDGYPSELEIFAKFNTTDTTIDHNMFLVNDDELSSKQSNAVLARHKNGTFVVAWMDERGGGYDIYYQHFSKEGDPLGGNVRVNDDEGNKVPTNPAIAVNEFGVVFVTWSQWLTVSRDLYGQFFDSEGVRVGSNFKVNDDDGNRTTLPSVAADANNNFIAVWEDKREGYFDIYWQRYASDGSPLGGNVKVDEEGRPGALIEPAIGADGVGNFIITWSYYLGEDDKIFGQRYGEDGLPIGGNFLVNDDDGLGSQNAPVISADGTGNFIIAWEDNRDGDIDIYAQQYDNSGFPIGDNFIVNEDETNASQLSPAICSNEAGEFVISWEDYSYGTPQIIGKAFLGDGSPIGASFEINDLNPSKLHYSPSMAFKSDTLLVAWYGNANPEQGYDIFAKGLKGVVSGYESPFDFSVDFSVSDDIGNGADLIFGMAPDATNGYDPNHDIVAPVFPPQGNFDARFIIDENQLIADYRGPLADNSSLSWVIQFTGSADADSISFGWNINNLPQAGLLKLMDNQQGNIVNINMREDSSLTIGATDLSELQIVYSLRTVLVQDIMMVGEADPYHVLNHNPEFSFSFFDGLGANQTHYQAMISNLAGAQNELIWDSGIIEGANNSLYYNQGMLLDGESYSVKVRAATGEYWSDWTELYFRMNSMPSEASSLYPNGEVEVGVDINLSIVNATDAESDPLVYNFRIFEDDALTMLADSAIAIIESADSTVWHITSPLMDDATYYWTVQAFDGYEYGSIAGPVSFQTNFPNRDPSIVDLVAPDSIVIQTLTPEMSWTPSIDLDLDDNVTYEMHWWRWSFAIDSVLTDTNVIILPRSLRDNTQYHWDVIALDNQGGQSISEVSTFWTDLFPEPPEEFMLLSPENEITGLSQSISFDWEASSDPDPEDIVTYTIEVASDSLFSQMIYQTNTGIESFYTLSQGLSMDTEYWWKVLATDLDSLITESETFKFTIGTVSIAGKEVLPDEFVLLQNYPNPFNPRTAISFGLPEETSVSLIIYDIRGNTIRTLDRETNMAGWYTQYWDGTDNSGLPVSTGIYITRLQAGAYSKVIKMLYLK